ncbi:fungal-specific transcription factor domain-containing protein [Mariannaea sp. PMI_226]|nr:fungal-specific transcription factor domain-containing protein [Mariannaea sp. PMI_226]
MSLPRSDENITSSVNQSIPPIEIGSFVALPADDSEFIGSASGVFFADTVFRAFARAASTTNIGRQTEQSHGTTDLSINTSEDQGQDQTTNAEIPDPGTAHTYLVATDEHDAASSLADDSTQSPLDSSQPSPGCRPYGIHAPSLGLAPPPTAAQRLVTVFFQHWHPFFPFLHGPTFIEQVDQFYSADQPLSNTSTHTPTSPRLMSRAILFQCIFNIAASTSHQSLDAACRIHSSAVLVSSVGLLMSHHDVTTLQAILAAELYLTVCMSLRDASTIHGALTRALFNAGFHRCPSRYIQLPPGTSDIRKRIFWCSYVLDRFISQSLGHPFSIQDADVDVCIPGMAELHTPVRTTNQGAFSQSVLNEQVLNHLPSNRRETGYLGNKPSMGPFSSNLVEDAPITYNSLSASSPAKNYSAVGKGANELILAYLVTYSRLLGDIVHLLHSSIQNRNINTNSIEDVTFKIHCWWNSLPAAFQDDAADGSSSPNPHSVVFKMLHNYLILLINRPFLSLPPGRRQFHSSLQAAITASRNIIVTLREFTQNYFLSAWPATLSAIWMSGLVIAFASLLELYPVAKAESDITCCLAMLGAMEPRWTSARHCRDALRTFLRRLKVIFGSGSQVASIPPSGSLSRDPTQPREPEHMATTNQRTSQVDDRRPITGASTWHQGPILHTGLAQAADVNLFELRDMMPVMAYNGPDFGFDAAHLIPQDFLNENNDVDMGSLFGNIG